ncbi:MAG: sigma-54-dependent transcriptional regulator [Oligoflexia bacterium]
MLERESLPKATVLLVDDDPQGLQSASRILEAHGYRVVTASDGQSALEVIRSGSPRMDVILTDVRMPRMTGLEFLKALSVLCSSTPVVLMTAFGRLEDAVWAMKLGAVDFLSKPFKRKQLLEAVSLALSRRGRVVIPTVSSSAAMAQLMGQVEQVARTQATLLIQGESGVGKERLAREIHSKSPRASGPFIGVNCAAIPESLLESELFGHEKGAFTGAQATKPGLFEAAAGGTLLLDEIGDMPLSLQAKLLRVLQEGEFRRVGSVQTRRMDVRLIAATHQDLRSRVSSGHFRQDLLYRLEVIVLQIPPLRERREDLPELLAVFLVDAIRRHSKTAVTGFSQAALQALLRHDWPGNVRELFNAVERSVVLCQGTQVEVEDLPPTVTAHSQAQSQAEVAISIPVGTSLREVEDILIRRTLEATQGDKELAAQLLGIAARTIYRKLGGPDA